MTNGLPWRGQLARIALRVKDVERATRFYETVLGLVRTADDVDSVRRLSWGIGDPVLELREGAPALDHYALEVADHTERDRLLDRASNAGVTIVERDADGATTHLLTDPEGRTLHIEPDVDRAGERIADTRRRPIRLQHITFATSCMDDLVAFYADTLGMRVSDRMGERFTWLRCGVEHHTIAMVESASQTGLDHFSFDLAGWMDFRDWCDRLAANAVPTSWGPGRHGPGNNLFIMFDDPDGYHIELSADMELYYDDRAEYVPRQWAQVAETVNLWGSAPAWRAPLQAV